jgi:hypothetical protein
MKMSPTQKSNEKILFLKEKKTLLLFSLYLAIGSVAVFIALIMLFTAYQGYIWSYTTKYVINSLATALFLLIASSLLLIGCYHLVKGKGFPMALGAIGCILLIVYPIYVLLVDSYVSYEFHYVLLLWVPAFIVLFILAYIWYTKKITE